MSVPECWAIGLGLFFYVASFFVTLISGRKGLAALMLLLALLSQLISASIRWYGIGHPPIFGTYEATLAASWFLALFVLLSYRSVHGHFRLMVQTGIPVSILILCYGFFFNTERIPLTISELSLWVDFHALFSWLAFAPFTLAFGLSVYFLFKSRTEQMIEGKAYDTHGNNAPDLGTIDELAFRYINFGFIMHTIMFALGCYYSSILYGVWWQWDPAESTSLITWLSVGLYIHMRLFYNWREKKAAWLFIVIFVTVIFSYWGLTYLPAGSTFHVFDIDLKSH